MSLLLMLSILGILFVCSLTIIIAHRRTRRRLKSKPNAPTDLSTDPWTESAKRMDDAFTDLDDTP